MKYYEFSKIGITHGYCGVFIKHDEEECPQCIILNNKANYPYSSVVCQYHGGDKEWYKIGSNEPIEDDLYSKIESYDEYNVRFTDEDGDVTLDLPLEGIPKEWLEDFDNGKSLN